MLGLATGAVLELWPSGRGYLTTGASWLVGVRGLGADLVEAHNVPVDMVDGGYFHTKLDQLFNPVGGLVEGLASQAEDCVRVDCIPPFSR